MILILAGAATTRLSAQDISAPLIKAEDRWTYLETIEKGPTGFNQTHSELTVNRVTPSAIYVTVKVAGSSQPPKEMFSGLDWSRLRDVNGKETVVNKPLSFPLAVGKTWDLRYSEAHPSKNHRSEEWTQKYSVVGYESVEVPAGKLNALKIEAEGRWTAELEPTQTVVQGVQSNANGTVMSTDAQNTTLSTASGRTYKAFWYAPETRRWVKSVEEYYGSNGVRNERYTNELESFKLQD
jgi:hypothetical protein